MKQKNRGFTLVELLVVIGIIAVLVGLLLPALSGARLQGQKIKCLANMKNIGVMMLIYSNQNHGLIVPLGPLMDGVEDPYDPAKGDGPGGGAPYEYKTLGSEVWPWDRWPVGVLTDIKYPPAIPGTPPGSSPPPDPQGTLAARWTSPLMICPSDPQPGAGHSYLLNQHLVQNQEKVLKYSKKPPEQDSPAQVVVLGEKRSIKEDYYMEAGDFPIDPSIPNDGHVELYRHGLKFGSNYLFLDFHADNKPPKGLSDYVDPWDITSTATSSS